MSDQSFTDFVLDQLSALPELRAKSMFGGRGLYCGEQFFSILDEGRLYFKVSDANRAAYVEQGMEPFSYKQRGRRMTMNYYEVPPDVLESRVELVAWAKRAIEVAASVPRKKKRLR